MSKIRELVSEGVRSVKEVERHLKIYTKSELFRGKAKPTQENRRFYPKRRDIRNHMYLATVKLRFFKIDQVNLEQKVKEWKKERPCDHFMFRGYGEALKDPVLNSATDENEDEVKVSGITSKQKLLFVHQAAWQKKLLAKYGNNICLLDATYRTTHDMPCLCFLLWLRQMLTTRWLLHLQFRTRQHHPLWRLFLLFSLRTAHGTPICS